MQGKPDSVQDKSFSLHDRIRSYLMRTLLTAKQAAQVMGVSLRHVHELIHEADVDKQSRWQFGREIINRSPKTSLKRTLRININVIIPVQ